MQMSLKNDANGGEEINIYMPGLQRSRNSGKQKKILKFDTNNTKKICNFILRKCPLQQMLAVAILIVSG